MRWIVPGLWRIRNRANRGTHSIRSRIWSPNAFLFAVNSRSYVCTGYNGRSCTDYFNAGGGDTEHGDPDSFLGLVRSPFVAKPSRRKAFGHCCDSCTGVAQDVSQDLIQPSNICDRIHHGYITFANTEGPIRQPYKLGGSSVLFASTALIAREITSHFTHMGPVSPDATVETSICESRVSEEWSIGRPGASKVHSPRTTRTQEALAPNKQRRRKKSNLFTFGKPIGNTSLIT